MRPPPAPRASLLEPDVASVLRRLEIPDCPCPLIYLLCDCQLSRRLTLTDWRQLDQLEALVGTVNKTPMFGRPAGTLRVMRYERLEEAGSTLCGTPQGVRDVDRPAPRVPVLIELAQRRDNQPFAGRRAMWKLLERSQPKSGSRPCDCPTRLGDPCPHIKAARHELPLARWALLLTHQFPRDYIEPPGPPMPHFCLSKEARVAVMIHRAAIKKSGGAPAHAIRHPADLDPRTVDHVSRIGTLAKNGRWRDAGLRAQSGRKNAGRGAWSVERESYRLGASPGAAEVHAGMVRLAQELAALDPDDAHARAMDYQRAIEAVRKAGPLTFGRRDESQEAAEPRRRRR